MRVSPIRVSPIRVSRIRLSSIRASSIRVSLIKVSMIRVSPMSFSDQILRRGYQASSFVDIISDLPNVGLRLAISCLVSDIFSIIPSLFFLTYSFCLQIRSFIASSSNSVALCCGCGASVRI